MRKRKKMVPSRGWSMAEVSVLDTKKRQKMASVPGVERKGGLGDHVWLEKCMGACHTGLCRFIGFAWQIKKSNL